MDIAKLYCRDCKNHFWLDPTEMRTEKKSVYFCPFCGKIIDCKKYEHIEALHKQEIEDAIILIKLE